MATIIKKPRTLTIKKNDPILSNPAKILALLRANPQLAKRTGAVLRPGDVLRVPAGVNVSAGVMNVGGAKTTTTGTTTTTNTTQSLFGGNGPPPKPKPLTKPAKSTEKQPVSGPSHGDYVTTGKPAPKPKKLTPILKTPATTPAAPPPTQLPWVTTPPRRTQGPGYVAGLPSAPPERSTHLFPAMQIPRNLQPIINIFGDIGGELEKLNQSLLDASRAASLPNVMQRYQAGAAGARIPGGPQNVSGEPKTPGLYEPPNAQRQIGPWATGYGESSDYEQEMAAQARAQSLAAQAAASRPTTTGSNRDHMGGLAGGYTNYAYVKYRLSRNELPLVIRPETIAAMYPDPGDQAEFIGYLNTLGYSTNNQYGFFVRPDYTTGNAPTSNTGTGDGGGGGYGYGGYSRRGGGGGGYDSGGGYGYDPTTRTTLGRELGPVTWRI